jgi:hypothetical protein
MPKSRQIIDQRQVTIFEYLEQRQGELKAAAPRPGSLDIDKRFREAISAAVKSCALSRYGIAARMSELAGAEITKSMLDSWTAESKEGHRFPAIFLPVFCEATGTTDPLTLLAELCGVFLLPGPDALRSEIKKLEEEIRVKQRDKNKRLLFLSEMERK